MVVFVILHYKNIEDTLECLQSIKNLKQQNKIKIVVVDNHSLTETEVKGIKKYTEDLLCLEENKGFAKANNIACKYAIEKYNPNFLIVINNDILIRQEEFIKKIEEDFKKYHFAILGPKIITNDGDSVNPFPVYKTLEEVEKQIAYSKKLIKIYSHTISTIALETYVLIKRKIKGRKILKNGDTIQKNVALHGCALIFSKEYYRKNEEIFDRRTFLFHEEEFLYQRMLNQKFITIYDPELEIFHKEGGSMNLTFQKKARQKKKFKQEEIVKSLEILKEEMRGTNEKRKNISNC